MQNILIEAVLMAFVIGGIVGAISALHLSRHPLRPTAPLRHSPPRDHRRH